MKKGFILALLVVAMVALVLPVSARAPIIKTLPTIIIGDADAANYDSGANLGILRYKDALDLGSTAVVDWNNDESYTPDTFHAYLYAPGTPATAIQAFIDGSIIDTLTVDEYTDVLDATAVPAATTEIFSTTNSALNLFDAGRHPAMTDPFNADPATEGVTPDAGYTREVAMKLVCGVTSGTVQAASDADLTVQCQSTATNDTDSPFTAVVDYTFTGADDGWTHVNAIAGMATIPYTTSGTGTTGIGFVQAAPITAAGCNYSGWASPAGTGAGTIPCTAADANKVYRVRASLESTSASGDTAIGFRLRYYNVGFAHQGLIMVSTETTPLAGDVLNVPTAGNPFEARVYWAARPDLGDMGDAEGQAVGFSAQGDARRYRVAFESIGFTGEQGTLTMESVTVESFARPAAVTPAVQWGTGGIAFNSTAGGFVAANTVSGFTLGTATTGTANTQLAMTGTGLRYCGVKPGFSTEAINAQLVPVSNRLYRFSVTVACGSRLAVPCYRVVVNPQIRFTAATLTTRRNVEYNDWFAYSDAGGTAFGLKNPNFKATGQVNCPFAPATTGSVMDSYFYSHNVAATSVGTSIFQPLLDVFDVGAYSASSAWPDAITPMTWSAASWEDLGADY